MKKIITMLLLGVMAFIAFGFNAESDVGKVAKVDIVYMTPQQDVVVMDIVAVPVVNNIFVYGQASVANDRFRVYESEYAYSWIRANELNSYSYLNAPAYNVPVNAKVNDYAEKDANRYGGDVAARQLCKRMDGSTLPYITVNHTYFPAVQLQTFTIS